MQRLYCAIERGEHINVHLLRFYDESQYVIAKSITGNDHTYLKKQLLNFKMEGHEVKGEPEYTFCGAFDDSGNTLSFKVENQIADPSNTWVAHDILSFKGRYQDESLHFKIVSKRTQLEIERVYQPTTEEELLKSI
ncbi:MAG: hypothetical protein V4604_03950 [Bacteroidota bacterium]